MPAIPLYTSSPINAAKASGVTPKTSSGSDTTGGGPKAPAPDATASKDSVYPPAAPGAVPSLPQPTGSVNSPYIPQPTRTQPVEDAGPPPPQPGAVPVAPGSVGHIPPPPKAGSTLQQQQQQQAPTTTTMPMPPQMSYPPPTASYSAYGGSSTTPAASAPSLGGYNANRGEPDFSHPPGYYQNINASDFDPHQRAAHDASVGETSLAEDAQGVWNAAKKWASVAGESIAQAESEVWKRVNKE